MSSGLYSTKKSSTDLTLNLSKLCPYGDTMNDAKVQISFTLPITCNAKATETARLYAKKMGLIEPNVALSQRLDEGFTFFVVYGSCAHTIDYNAITVNDVESTTMTMDETNKYIEDNIGRKVVVVGASTGTDAHTVGIDAILNRKGFAGHYGLERYDMVTTYNLGSQVDNADFIEFAKKVNADILLVSQTVTQKDIHIANLTNLVELLEADGLRSKVVLICGGARITHELAKELGYDAGFGVGKYADDVISFAVQEMVERKLV
ncbi:MAG: OAM dimerization domain-containing protein [Clostridia bacterium]|nr:OAM dimerization domain-containing protein [Clostridia bacterium]